MATMSITITVTGRMAGNTVTWSRSSEVTDLLTGIHRIGDGGTFITASESTKSTGSMYSTGMAVCAIIPSNAGSLLGVGFTDGGNLYPGGVAQPGIPMLYYNGAGAGGFNGGVNVGSSAALDPTVDIDQIFTYATLGSPSYAALVGTKLIS